MQQHSFVQQLDDACMGLNQGALDRKHKITYAQCFITIFKSQPSLVDSYPIDRIFHGLRDLLGDPDTIIRSKALRAYRHTLLNRDGVTEFFKHHIHIYTVRSLDREPKYLWERLQALKLMRKLIALDSTRVPVSCVRSLIASAAHKDDQCRRVCLETLRELTIVNVAIVARCDGIKTLMDAILDPTYQDLAPSLVLTIVFVSNEFSTRQFLRPAVDLHILLAPFTETDVPAGSERRQRWNASRAALVMIMRSWTGILLLASEPRGGLRSLVKLLVQPVGEDVQKAVLGTIFEIFYMPPPFVEKSSSSASGSSTESTTTESHEDRRRSYSTFRRHDGVHPSIPPHNLLDNYTIMILLAFIHCGLLDALIQLGLDPNTSRELAKPATELLRELLHLSRHLLPEEHCARLLALPALVNVASTVAPSITLSQDLNTLSLTTDLAGAAEGRGRSIRSSEMLAQLSEAVSVSASGKHLGHLCTRMSSRHLASQSNHHHQSAFVQGGVHMASELLHGTNRPLQQQQQKHPVETNHANIRPRTTSREQIVSQLKSTLDAQMDDQTFKEMLYQRSRVLLGKDWFKWDWNIITELLEGPLMNPSRLSEAMKTKFFKRLSGFFRCDPGNKGYFAQLPWIPDYVPYIRPACQMYTLLLNHPEGMNFLKTDRRGQLLNEIAAALELEARPEAAIVESHIGALQARMFSPEFCSRRMLREYFTLLGLMSSSPEGLSLLEQSNLFQRLYVLGKMQGHDFLCRLILANLDYTFDGSSRNLLQLWMTDGSKSLRLYATSLLRALVRSHVSDFASWGIDILVTQLHQEPEVARAALSVLDEAAQTPEYLLAMILKRPEKLVDLDGAENLFLKFLSLPEGLSFLRDMGSISGLVERWKSTQVISYVHRVEAALAHGLLFHSTFGTNNSGQSSIQPEPIPIPVKVPQGKTRESQEANDLSSDWSLEWLFRLPWNMEVKMVGPSGSGPPTNLTLDTFIDASAIQEMSSSSSVGQRDCRNLIKVKGIVVDARNIAQPVSVSSQQTLQACLFLGTQPIDRKGFTKPSPQSNGGFILSYGNTQNNSSTTTNNSTRHRSASSSSSTFDGGQSSSDRSRSPPSSSTTRSHHHAASSVSTEEHKDWSLCRPEQRKQLIQHATKSECTICCPNERALWTFAVESSSSLSSSTSNNNTSSKRVWLKSVEFTLKLLPDKPRFVQLPSHLYGELAKTNAGCDLLTEAGHLPELLRCLECPASVPLERRAALWALGHVAATSRGFELIRKCTRTSGSSSLRPDSDDARDDFDFVETLITLVTRSTEYSIRGTTLYVLGLVSRSAAGRRCLHERGWESPRDPRATATVPVDVSILFHQRLYRHVGAPADTTRLGVDSDDPILSHRQGAHDDDSVSEFDTILTLVSNLSSHITQKEAHLTLSSLKASTPAVFDRPELRLAVNAVLERLTFRLAARQFIHNLVDRAPLTNASWKQMEKGSSTGEKFPETQKFFTEASAYSLGHEEDVSSVEHQISKCKDTATHVQSNMMVDDAEVQSILSAAIEKRNCGLRVRFIGALEARV